ncbi:MAG TPA: hypothetical protein VHK47_14560 [Polyangia bacterium]|jgi:hypothetical protein|nr:hypothetical protein [Polyangia bacterium]
MGARREIALMTFLLLAPFCGRAVAAGGERDEEVPRENPPDPPRPVQIETPAPRSDWQVYGVFGVGTPVGISGFEGVHRLGQVFEVSAGVGCGISAALAQPNSSFAHTLQWSVMPRLRLGDDGGAFTLGVGVSGGEYSAETGFCIGCEDSSPGPHSTEYAVWTNFEIGGEHLNGGLAFRYFLGLARAYSATGASNPIPYLGVGLGYAF